MLTDLYIYHQIGEYEALNFRVSAVLEIAEQATDTHPDLIQHAARLVFLHLQRIARLNQQLAFNLRNCPRRPHGIPGDGLDTARLGHLSQPPALTARRQENVVSAPFGPLPDPILPFSTPDAPKSTFFRAKQPSSTAIRPAKTPSTAGRTTALQVPRVINTGEHHARTQEQALHRRHRVYAS